MVTTSSHGTGGPSRILLLEDDPDVAEAVEAALAAEGHGVETAGSLADARRQLEKHVPDMVLLDLGLPDGNGADLIPEVRALEEEISLVVLTGTSELATVVETMKRGADNFLPKPVERHLLVETVAHELADLKDRRHAAVYRGVVRNRPRGDLQGIVGSSAAMERVREQALHVAGTGASVVLLGESGTGKGMVAREIHRNSRRAAGPFVDVNCATLQPQLVESEIFGHEKGAFTGAVVRKPGLLEVAHGGTLFMDEVADLDLQAQAKLLKAIEERSFRRVGGVRSLSVDVRLIAATHRDLEERVAEGTFREDLFYRLCVFPIQLPPLRARAGDILELAEHFIATLNPVIACRITGLSESAAEILSSYPWPGNVRELRNVIERAMILAGDGLIRREHLPVNLTGPAAGGRLASLADVEREHIAAVLRATGANVKRSAQVLGISRSTLYDKMKRYDLER